ncbi:class I adenylate-forming enzyme family protein [Thalassovita taeanensis]|uniref:Acyl-CoA synthetase (AMP-forming)/AMP-acid ligase II n=1 Tax=Thalassovita taeanensis TaxID=657014 RepID=A0A1H8Z551_9RHOB|nr:class I adenylate-forming enzyme family protein [Thalassovita taeanensis]SEP59564.1 Acyl-CoA synthetase (AMP-forming)/AMP-acid ligase II [Thalassovita taeanensis]
MLAVFDRGAPAPCPVPFNMAAYVLGCADALPEKTALAVLSPAGPDIWSYARLKAAVLGTGAGLLARGFRPGDILLMRLGNTVEFPLAYLGAIAVGIVPVPTSSMLTAPEVAKMVAQLSPAGILRDAGVACPDDTGLPVIGTDELLAMRDLPPADYAMGDPERLAYIIFTSGTSGNPRAVCHAHRAVWARRMMHDGWCGLRSDDRLLHAGAFNWTYTLGTGLMDPWSVGATALIPAEGVAIEALPELLKANDATIFAAAPGVYRKLLNHHPKLDLPNLRHGLSAGEKLSETIRAQWNAATGGKLIFEAYGMSECSTFISASPTALATQGTLGRPQVGRRVAIVDDDGPVEIGQEGTIAIARSDPGLMLGYYGAEAETAERMQGAWFLTGDHGAMAEDGQIAYLGRVDDMMNAGGYRVSPLEVEAVLHHAPGLRDVGVTDIEVKEDARIIAAFYTSDAALDEDSLRRYAEDRLARYKQPRVWVRIDAMPTNPNGKLSRRALKALYPAG